MKFVGLVRTNEAPIRSVAVSIVPLFFNTVTNNMQRAAKCYVLGEDKVTCPVKLEE